MSSGIPLIICSVLATVAFGAARDLRCLQIRHATAGASLLTSRRAPATRTGTALGLDEPARPAPRGRSASGRRSGHGHLGGWTASASPFGWRISTTAATSPSSGHHRADQERAREAVGERDVGRHAVRRSVARAAREDGREQRHADRAADLLRRVDEARRQSGLVVLTPMSAAIVTGMNAKPRPMPARMKPGARSPR